MTRVDVSRLASGQNLVHRDVEPANLFVSRKGVEYEVLKVFDFGLANRWPSDEPAVSGSLVQLDCAAQTAFGQIAGTPAFIAPETALGQDAVDHRADLDSLYAALARALVAGTLFRAWSLERGASWWQESSSDLAAAPSAAEER
jgi:serine/threonine protein kinase